MIYRVAHYSYPLGRKPKYSYKYYQSLEEAKIAMVRFYECEQLEDDDLVYVEAINFETTRNNDDWEVLCSNKDITPKEREKIIDIRKPLYRIVNELEGEEGELYSSLEEAKDVAFRFAKEDKDSGYMTWWQITRRRIEKYKGGTICEICNNNSWEPVWGTIENDDSDWAKVFPYYYDDNETRLNKLFGRES